MRHLVIAASIAIGMGLIAYVLLTPAFLGDYRSLFLALPFLLLITREVYEHVPALLPEQTRRRLYAMTLEPIEDEANEPADEGAVSLDGFWVGTVRVWPRSPEEILRVYPLRLVFAGGQQLAVSTLGAEPGSGDGCLAGLEVVAFDPLTGDLDLGLKVQNAAALEHCVARLCLVNGRLVPEDESELVTVELVRAQLVPRCLRRAS